MKSCIGPTRRWARWWHTAAPPFPPAVPQIAPACTAARSPKPHRADTLSSYVVHGAFKSNCTITEHSYESINYFYFSIWSRTTWMHLSECFTSVWRKPFFLYAGAMIRLPHILKLILRRIAVQQWWLLEAVSLIMALAYRVNILFDGFKRLVKLQEH